MSQTLKISPAVIDAIAEAVVEKLNAYKPSKEYFGELLSKREIEILTYIASGLTNDRIGYRLNTSSNTVKNQIAILLKKMDASARTEAVAIGIRTGIIS